ncbi:hypothetical protein JTE90_029118 [Oedothorax gibbosus]|uniref:Uncharacterized protein n=1 Tax=Oedothorax gibbosus TaxID=931172 RepID=A0AAV6TRG8_9ARAC|nr:hypothetical protein JTE90_029118 [Oedothorax gibbosus]
MMARFVMALLLLACLVSLSLSIDTSLKQKDEDYDCYNKNLCNCNGEDDAGIDHFQDCFDIAGKQIQEWYVGEVNKCKGLSKPIQNGPVESWVPTVCALDDQARKDCYLQVNERVRVEYQNALQRKYGREVQTNAQKALNCVTAIISKCYQINTSNEPDECIQFAFR